MRVHQSFALFPPILSWETPEFKPQARQSFFYGGQKNPHGNNFRAY
jgi:hypothetical protein